MTLPENDVDLASVKRVILVACGTAYFAGLVGKNWIERYAGIPASVDIASEFRYSEAPLDPECLAIFVSQSGETADTLAALNHCKANGLKTMGIVNVPDSSITREVDVTLPTYAGPEIGVASTKAFTAQLGALAAFAISWVGRNKHFVPTRRHAWLIYCCQRRGFPIRCWIAKMRLWGLPSKSVPPPARCLSGVPPCIRWRLKVR